MKKFYGVLVGVGASVLAATNSFALDFYTVPTLDTAGVGTMATAILAGLALIWGVRKAIKVINRS